MKKNIRFASVFLVVLFSIAVFSTVSRADEIYTFVVKKQEEKAKSRWSLTDWLNTRDRMRMMDLWLDLHSPTPYEFYLGGALESGKTEAGQKYQGGIGYLAAYATVFGLEIQREQSFAHIWNGLFHLRIFGRHAQATNITLEGGLRFRGSLRSPVAGAALTLYFTKFFGADGLYRMIFNSNTDSFNTRVKGYRVESNAFIDFSFARVYGGYFYEQETASMESRQSVFPRRSGALAGLRLFF